MTMESVAMKRKNEADNEDTIVPIRSERLFMQHNYWYFRTREGMEIGPFDSAKEANEGINGFMDFVSTAKPEVVERVTDYVTRAAQVTRFYFSPYLTDTGLLIEYCISRTI